MKIFIAVLAILAVTNYATAGIVLETSHEPGITHGAPTRLEDVDTNGGIDIGPSSPILRQRRLTCDVFSFESGVVTPNHAACALKCIAMRKKGGHCEDTTCVCRSDTWI